MTQPLADMSAELTEVERSLVLAVARGEVVDLRRQPIRGALLRSLVLEQHPGCVVPQAGIRIERAIVTGGLDLEGAVVDRPLMLRHSRIEAAAGQPVVNLRDARLKRIGIHNSTLEGDILADRVEVSGGMFVGGGIVRGVLQARGADIRGALAIEGTEVGNGTDALLLAGLRVSGPLILRRATLAGAWTMPRAILGTGIYGEEAAVRGGAETVGVDLESLRSEGDLLLDRARLGAGVSLIGAIIGGRIAARGLVCGAGGLALRGAQVAQSVDLTGAVIDGPLDIAGVRVGGELTAESAEVHGGETAIAAPVARIGGNCNLARAKLVGEVAMAGADIAGQLRMTEARLYGAGVALRGDGMRVRGGVFMSGATVVGRVRLPAADIGNQLRLSGASLKVESGVALMAPGARIMRDAQMDDGFRCVGGLLLDQIRVGGTLTLTGSHVASVAVSHAAHRAAAAEAVRRPLDRADRIALSLVDADVERLVMPDRAANRPRGVVDLSRARAGAFEDFAAAWPPAFDDRAMGEGGEDIDHMVLDGFAYEHLANPSGRAHTQHGAGEAHSHRDDHVAAQRIRWLDGQPMADIAEHLRPQAWVYLAQRLAAQGYGEDARAVSIARRRRERRSHAATHMQRFQGVMLDVLALYGFNPWRTVVWMVACVLLFAAVFGWASRECERSGCFDERVFVVSNRDAYTPSRFENSYPAFDPLAYSLDVFLPFVALGYEDHWRPNMEFAPVDMWAPWRRSPAPDLPSARALTVGALLYVATVVEAILGLVLTSLAVTGFTGLLRSDD